jgi:hypothetical protein
MSSASRARAAFSVSVERHHQVTLRPHPRILVINAATGELLRELTFDPSRNYQPT